MSQVPVAVGRSLHRAADMAAPAGTLPYGWAKMVLYQRGADYPLGTRLAAGAGVAIETTERRTVEAFPGSRSQRLKAGFVGRRQEMHALRRNLREGRRLHVVQGTGGIGKSAFCSEALKVYARLGWQPLALWCADVEGAAEPVVGLVRQVDVVGAAWDNVLATVERVAAQREEVRQPATHLLLLVQLLLEAETPLVVYLDNLESLQSGPSTDDPDAFAGWRDPGCAALWRGLRNLVRSGPGRLAVLASTRYRHPDFGAVMPFHRLPDDAMWRMLEWFPNLRRLSNQARAGLVARLAGHPRAIEFLDALIEDAILSWEYDNNIQFEPSCVGTEEEQAQIVDVALPVLDTKLSEDLLFDALWDRVLNAPARDLLVRAGVLRRPADQALLAALAGDDGKPAIDKLRTTGLLTEIREPKAGGGWMSAYEVHPLVRELAERRSDRAEALRQEGHRRAGDHLEQMARTFPPWQDNLDGAYHLRQVGDVNRAYDLLHPFIVWLVERGRALDARAVLAEIGDPVSLHPTRGAWISIFHGDASVAYGDLVQGLAAYLASVAMLEQLVAADPSNAQRQHSLSIGFERLGKVLMRQGRLDDALKAYQTSLAIAERLAAADPSNAQWQYGLGIYHERLGTILSARGKLAEALKAFEAKRAIIEQLVAADPSNDFWQRDLSVSHEKMGDVLMWQGRLDDALKAYQASLAIAERLAMDDPSNAQWQRDVSIRQGKVGDVLMRQGRFDDALKAYQASLAIAERLAAADPSNTEWQRDLLVSQGQVGEVLTELGRLDDALKAYQASLAIAERLAAADPSNAQWQRDLSINQIKVGDVLAALSSPLDGVGRRAIAERLAMDDPSNAQWQRDVLHEPRNR